MDCKTCDDSFGFYKRSVSLFRNAVLNTPGCLGDDSRLAAEEADRLRLKCRDASDALMAHWRKAHRRVTEKLGSSKADEWQENGTGSFGPRQYC